MSSEVQNGLTEEQVKQLKKFLSVVSINDEQPHSEDVDDEDTARRQREIRQKNKEEYDKVASSAHLIYVASRIRIYKIATNIASYRISTDIKLRTAPCRVAIPECEKCDFRLGDVVKIKYSIEDIKYIQESTVDWDSNLHYAYDCLAIVTRCRSEYDSFVGIFVPKVKERFDVYAGILEKVDTTDKKSLDSVPSQFQKGDYVVTKIDRDIVNNMQKGLDDIYIDNLGTKGRVIGVTRAGILVTFDEKEGSLVNPYLLISCKSTEPIRRIYEEHPRGFEVGETVTVISDHTRVTENQKKHGNWDENMSPLIGKKVTIVDITKDDLNLSLIVRLGRGRNWRLSPDSVLRENEEGDMRNENMLEIGDAVKFSMVPNIRSILEEKNIPTEFLEYLRMTACLELLDTDVDYFVRYNINQNVSVFANTLVSASEDEKQKYLHVDELVEKLEVGSKVYLDVGPPNYVSHVLREVEAKYSVIQALTSSATLIGFADDNRAVIEYEDGSRYKIKKKFLTVPEKFNVSERREEFTVDVAREIQERFQLCVQMIHDEFSVKQREDVVKMLSFSCGSPSKVDLRVHTTAATFKRITEHIPAVYNWTATVLCDGVLLMKMNEIKDEVKISLFFNNEEYLPIEEPRTTAQNIKPKDTQRAKTTVTERPLASAGVAQFASRGGHSAASGEDTLNVEERIVGNFSYLAFADYFVPVKPNRSRRVGAGGDNRAPPPSVVNNNFHMKGPVTLVLDQ